MAQTIETRNSVRAQKNSHADGIKGSRLKLVDTLYQGKKKTKFNHYKPSITITYIGRICMHT